MTNEELLEQQKKAGETSLAETTANNTDGASLAQESSTVTQTQNYLQSLLKDKPSNFNSQYTQQLESLYDKIMNRDKFSYDVAGDPLYQQYKNQYAQMGQLAMQDAIGNASALTGGYGNSWAETAGNQAYQAYLQQLNNKVPELYESAFDRYTQEGNDLQNQLALTSELYENDYQKYMDNLAYMQQMQQTAYSQVMSMINAGLTPPDELIAAAGLSKDALGLNAPGPSSNNNNNKKNDTNGNYNTELETLKILKDNNLKPTANDLKDLGLTEAQWANYQMGAMLPRKDSTPTPTAAQQAQIQSIASNSFKAAADAQKKETERIKSGVGLNQASQLTGNYMKQLSDPNSLAYKAALKELLK